MKNYNLNTLTSIGVHYQRQSVFSILSHCSDTYQRAQNHKTLGPSTSHRLSTIATITLGLLVVLLGGLFFSHSAYAGTSISIASGSSGNNNVISFGNVKPSSSGSVVTASDELTITTDCTAGSNVYISATNNSTTNTNLVNNAGSSNNTIATLSGTTIGTTALPLENNTWGFNTTNNNTYYGLPAYANATDHAIYSGTNTTVPIYYGAKVTNSLVPGKYIGQVLYTATVNSSCLTYTVIFNKNADDATGTMNNQTMAPAASTALTSNGFTRPGYIFLGWSTDQNATTPTYTDGQAVTDLAQGSESITLYAVWGQTMQGFADNFGCANLAMNDVLTLYDSRDYHAYRIKKLPDNKCWMIQNLTLSSTDLITNGKALTNADTNIPDTDANIYYVPPKSTRYAVASSINNQEVATASSSINFGQNEANQPQIGYKQKGTTDNAHSGTVPEDTAYYNFYTATLGFSYYGDGKTAGSSPRDICPKGWRLPWNSDTGTTRQGRAEFYALALAYSSDSSAWNDYISPDSSSSSLSPNSTNSTIRNNMIYGDTGSLNPTSTNNGAAGFTYAGQYDSATLAGVGLGGRYWSSSIYDSNDAYRLGFNTSIVTPQINDGKYLGNPVRCVAQYANATGYMQDFKLSSLETNEYTILADKRDKNEYAVKKLPDGKVWMVQNLRLTNYKLTSTDSNVFSDFDMTSSNTAQSGSTGWCTTNSESCSNKISAYYDTSSRYEQGALYNWYTATAGTGTYSMNSGDASSSICPKGWRLPTGGPNSEIVALNKAYGGNGSQQSGNSQVVLSILSKYMGDYTSGVNGNFTLSGSINGELGVVGSRGINWTSTAKDNSNAYRQYLYYVSGTTIINPQDLLQKYIGFSVRCVASEYMQDFSTSSLGIGEYTTLIDKRDGRDYIVKKLPDGKVWMVQNLGLNGSMVLTNVDSDISSNFTLNDSTLYPDSTNPWCQTQWDSSCIDKVLYYYNSSKGGLYNWYTATAGSGTDVASGNAPNSICPKGWRLPTGGSSGEFANLDIAYGGSGNNRNNASTYTLFADSYDLGNSGNFTTGTGYVDGQWYGIYEAFDWSSSATTSGYSYGLYLNSTNSTVGPQLSMGKASGRSVRCIAR